MTSLHERVEQVTARLRAAGIENARSEAWLLIAAATGRGRSTLMAGASTTLNAEQDAALEALLRRRQKREPIAYILGEKEFWSLRFEVDPAVLIPRPETETVVEAAQDQIGDKAAALRVLDLGTGSGCLLLALLFELRHASGLGVDDSPAALSVAQRNADRLGVAGRCKFRLGRWGENLSGHYDVIVSNPPYVAEDEWGQLQPEIRCFEPEAALVAGPDGLAAYRALAPDCARLMAAHGLCALEIGYGQGDAVAEIFGRHALHVTKRYRDLAGIERCLVVRHDAADHVSDSADDPSRRPVAGTNDGAREG